MLLNKAGIESYEQLSRLTAEDIPELARTMEVLPHVVKEDWFMRAHELLQKKTPE